MRNRVRILTLCLSTLLGVIVFSGMIWASGKININTASLTELETLSGIGPVIAERIIEYRETNGPFTQVADIQNVKGIGETIFSKIKDSITTTDEEGGDSGGQPNEETNIPVVELSGHSTPRKLSQWEEVKVLEIDAGRPRLTPINTPLLFEASVNLKNLSKKADVTWSFGDGTSKRGLLARHSYAAPGTYVVMATIRQGQNQASARTTVEAFVPEIELIPSLDFGGSIKLVNRSKYESNLGGWSLIYGDQKFVLAPDTIVLPQTAISISAAVAGFPPGVDLVELRYPLGQLATRSAISPKSEARPPNRSLAPSSDQQVYDHVARSDLAVSQLAGISTLELQSTVTAIELPRRAGFFSRLINKLLPGR